jgi:hypothetical protein
VVPSRHDEPVDGSELTAPERLLCKEFPAGGQVDLRTGGPERDDVGGGASWGPERTIRAEVIAGLLLNRERPAGGVARLRLAGARISGRLDLDNATIDDPVEFDECWFDEGVGLTEATTRGIRFRRCRLPHLEASGVEVRGPLALVGSWLDWLSLYGGHVAGQLDVSGAHLEQPGATALNADLLTVGATVYAHDVAVRGAVRLPNATIKGQLELHGAHLANPGGYAFVGGGLNLGGGLLCGRGFRSEGTIAMRGATIGGSLDLGDAHLANPGGEALTGARLVIGHDLTSAPGLTVEGQIRLHGARIEGAVELAGARLSNPDSHALTAYRLTVGGGVFCVNGFTTDGTLHLPLGHVTGRFNLYGATLRNPDRDAVNLNGTTIEGNLNCSRLTVHGRFGLWQTVVTGQVDFTGATLTAGGDEALCAEQLQARALILRTAEPITGGVDLRYATVGRLSDDPAVWPARVRLGGFEYDEVKPPLRAAQRLAWLGRDPDGYLPQVYEQLAAVYRRLGHDGDARRILAAKQRRWRESLSPPTRVWGYLQDVTVGYGYRPGRAGLWLLALLLIGTTVFGLRPPARVDPGQGPAFNALVYTLDLLLPVIDFGQERAYQPRGAAQWLAYGLIAAGWILATTVAAGLTRVLNRS